MGVILIVTGHSRKVSLFLSRGLGRLTLIARGRDAGFPWSRRGIIQVDRHGYWKSFPRVFFGANLLDKNEKNLKTFISELQRSFWRQCLGFPSLLSRFLIYQSITLFSLFFFLSLSLYSPTGSDGVSDQNSQYPKEPQWLNPKTEKQKLFSQLRRN